MVGLVQLGSSPGWAGPGQDRAALTMITKYMLIGHAYLKCVSDMQIGSAHRICTWNLHMACGSLSFGVDRNPSFGEKENSVVVRDVVVDPSGKLCVPIKHVLPKVPSSQASNV